MAIEAAERHALDQLGERMHDKMHRDYNLCIKHPMMRKLVSVMIAELAECDDAMDRRGTPEATVDTYIGAWLTTVGRDDLLELWFGVAPPEARGGYDG